MSRIGKAPITVPSGVDVTVDGRDDHGQGPEGHAQPRRSPATIRCQQDDGDAARRRAPTTSARTAPCTGSPAASSTTWSSASPTASRKQLEIVGVGYRAEAQGPSALRLALGFSHPVNVNAPDGITFEVPVPTQVVVSGIDKEVVGQVAANIRSIRKPEPYKGKGVRYQGEKVLRKAGKAGKK